MYALPNMFWHSHTTLRRRAIYLEKGLHITACMNTGTTGNHEKRERKRRRERERKREKGRQI